MNAFWPGFWTAIIVLSIGWYALMLFYVGIKGGKEIVQMTQNLSRRADPGNGSGQGRDQES